MSMMRECDFFKATDGKWWMFLAHDEYGAYPDGNYYGPFNSEEAAHDYLFDNFSNPGGSDVDNSGTQKPPTEHNPDKIHVVNPRAPRRPVRWY